VREGTYWRVIFLVDGLIAESYNVYPEMTVAAMVRDI